MKYLSNKNNSFFQILSKYFLGIVVVAYLIINFIIYQGFWQELNFDGSSVNAVYGEVSAVEWSLEGVYQNLIQGKNPFAVNRNLFYPFGTNFVSAESGNAFYFLFTRPFLSTHQSLYLISALSIVAANLGMYLLIKALGVKRIIAFFIGLFFGYMTFLQPRMGHITYLSIYVFPWFYYSGLKSITSHLKWKKASFAVLMSFFLVMSLYHNLYYFVMLAFSIGLGLIYGLMKEKKFMSEIWHKNFSYLVIFITTSLIFLSPWLVVFHQTQQFETLPKAQGWSGAIEYSADLLGYFFPSVYSKYLGRYTEIISLKLEFLRGVFENFAYPGLIILGSAWVYLVWHFTQKEVEFRKKYALLTVMATLFWLLTLGPFLHIAGRWCAKPLPGVCLAIPMPFVLFHYLPFMSNIRSPGRLMVGFIFFAYILAGLIINRLFKKSSRLLKYLLIGSLAIIFVIDHQFIYSPAQPKKLPHQIYQTIKQDPDFFTVYQLPSIMRDGFVYFGDLSSLSFFPAQLKHGKPVLAGYAGRFPGYKTTYYMNDPFLGYFGRLMDTNLDKNPRIDPDDPTDWTQLNLAEAKKSIDFLDIKYVIVDENKTYALEAEAVLEKLGFMKQMTTEHYSLWLLQDQTRAEYLVADFSQPGHQRHLGMGWFNLENHQRWSDQKSSLLFNVRQARKLSLEFVAASFYQPQVVKIFFNQQLAGQINLGLQKQAYQLALPTAVDGINTLHFVFEKSFQPQKVAPDNNDQRSLSAQFSYIKLKE